jgi:hypothetical protein
LTLQIAARGISARLEPDAGMIPTLTIDGAQVLFAAPWRQEAEIQAARSIPLVDRRLGGCFFCAPFGTNSSGPPHGAPANTRWIVKHQSAQAVTWRLAQAVNGARITARLSVRDGHPVLYQEHDVAGGQGAMTFAYHPMVQMAAGGTLRMAPKRAALTEGAPQLAGASLWACGQDVAGWDLTSVDGRARDLRVYPAGPCEDFVTLIEAQTHGLGWTALHRDAEDDTVLILKDRAALPVTMLWISNGARTHAPWNGRCHGVLGIEDAVCAGGAGFAAATHANRIAAHGVPTCRDLGAGPYSFRHAIARLAGQRLVADVTLDAGLHITFEDGSSTRLPFDTEFFR